MSIQPPIISPNATFSKVLIAVSLLLDSEDDRSFVPWRKPRCEAFHSAPEDFSSTAR
jgi:hypothetical protein